MTEVTKEVWESDLGYKVRSMCIKLVVGNTGMAAVQQMRAFINALNKICPELKYNPYFGPQALMGWEYNASEVADKAVDYGLSPETVTFIASVHLLPDG